MLAPSEGGCIYARGRQNRISPSCSHSNQENVSMNYIVFQREFCRFD